MNNPLSYEYLKESLKEKYLYFARLSQLNDPFDSYIPENNDVTDIEIQNWLTKYMPETKIPVEMIKREILMRNNINSDVSKQKDNMYVLSLTATEKNEMMWALYAENYEGICLGYRAFHREGLQIDGENYFYIPFDYLQKYKCVSGIVNINNVGIIHFHKVHYDNDGTHKHCIFRNESTQFEIDYNIFHKKQCWNSEKEYKAFLMQDKNMPVFDQKVHYNDNTLAEVIFGYKASPGKIKEIMGIVKRYYKKDSNISFFRLEPDYKNYCLCKILIKDAL